jgi:hypothetical protein
MIIDCIAKPYDNFGKSSLGKDAEPVYDCFGNCYEKLDDFHRYAMSLDPTVAMNLNSKKCYAESATSESFHPLETCGIPFSYVGTVIDYR